MPPCRCPAYHRCRTSQGPVLLASLSPEDHGGARVHLRLGTYRQKSVHSSAGIAQSWKEGSPGWLCVSPYSESPPLYLTNPGGPPSTDWIWAPQTKIVTFWVSQILAKTAQALQWLPAEAG